MEYEDLKFCWDIIDCGEFYDEEKDIQISFGEVSFVSKGDWNVSLGGYDTGYEVQCCGETICRINYEYREYTWYGTDEVVTTLSKKEVLKIFEACNFKERS